MNDRWELISDIFYAALQRPPEERPAFLRQACGQDSALEQEIESLLRCDPSLNTFLETPAVAMETVSHDLADPTRMLGRQLGPYEIVALLGVGGMGEVYRARDLTLGRDVAIKILPSRFTTDQEHRARLTREARILATLSHPHIGVIYGLEEVDGGTALVLELVEGPTLSDRLASGSLSTGEALAIALQIGEALHAAHTKGIVHRDLKPANVVVQTIATATGPSLRVRVLDFGLSKLTGFALTNAAKDHPSAWLTTEDGRIAGTPAYMSPEQVRGQPVDERADIWAFGCILFEMFAGRRVFKGDTAADTFARILGYEPEWAALRSDTPAPIRRLLDRCLQKDIHNRLQTITEAVREIDDSLKAVREPTLDPVAVHRQRLGRVIGITGTTAIVIALLVLGGTRLNWAKWRSGSVAPLPAQIHLAVLPFSVAPDDKGRQFFTQGLIDSLNATLSRLTVSQSLQVTTAADVRKWHVTTPREAREQLGANVAMTGSLRHTGNVLQITSQLIETRSGRTLRTETVTANAADPLSVDDQIVESAVRMLGLTVPPHDRNAIRVRDTAQPGAYDYYLQARGYLLNYDRLENIESAISVFRKALDIDKRYALAYAGLGESYWRKHELTGSSTWVEPSRAACEGALGIDPDVAEPHACLGMVLAGTGDYEKAATEYAAALSLEPTDDVLYLGLANAYEKLGRQGDAEQAFRKAIQLRPQYWGAYNMMGAYYYRSGRYDEALTMFQQVVALTPDSYRGYSSIGAIYFMKDQTSDAIAAFQKSLSIKSNYAAASNLGTLYYFDGDYRKAADLFKQALSMDQGNYQVWVNLAGALAAAGEDATVAFRGARDRLRESIGVNARDAALFVELANSEFALGDTVAARSDFEQALKLEPTEAHTLFKIATFYEYRLGKRSDALAWLSKAVAHGQTWREIDRSPLLRDLRADPRFAQLRK